MKTIQEQQQAGYLAAEFFDLELNKRAEAFPPMLYPYYWVTITRTVQSTLNLIVEQAKAGIKEGTAEAKLEAIEAELNDITTNDRIEKWPRLKQLLKDRADILEIITTSP